MPVPGLTTYPNPPDRGPLAIRGQVRMRSGENEAQVVGITIGPGTFGDAPEGTLLGNLTPDTDPVRPWDMATFAGLGITYSVSALAANFVEITQRVQQTWDTEDTDQVYNYPADLVPEDLLLVVITTGGLTTITTPSGWTLEASTASSTHRTAVYSRIIDGTEAATEAITFGTAAGGLVRSWVIDRAHGDIDVTSASDDTGSATTLDIGSVAPSWSAAGATQNLYIAVLGLDAEASTTISGFPTSYADTGQDALVSATATINCRLGFGERFDTSSSEDPSAFTFGAARAVGHIIAIRAKNAGRLNWDGVGVRKNSTGSTFTRRRINFIEGTGVTITVADDSTDDEVDVTINSSGGGGSQGWDDTLAIDKHTGANNPTIDTSQYIQFGTSDTTVVSGQIRSDNFFEIRTGVGLQIRAGEEITLTGPDSHLFTSTAGAIDIDANTGLTLTSGGSTTVDSGNDFDVTTVDDTTFNVGGLMTIDVTETLTINVAGVVDLNSTTDVINLQGAIGVNLSATSFGILMTTPGSTVLLSTGFLEFAEAAASTPSMSAGRGLFWVRNDTPNNPMFTDDTNTDRQIATYPLLLTGFPAIADDTFLANISGGAAAPTAVALSTLAGAGLTGGANAVLNVTAGAGGSIVVNANDIQRGALTGAITASADSNTTAFGALAAKSVLANATNSSAVPAALAGSAAFQHLRVNAANTGLEWSVFTSGDFPAGVVPLTSLETQAANTMLANATAGTASPTAVAVSDNSFLGRSGGNISNISSAVQTALIRGSGNMFWAGAAADQVLRRSGSGDLGFGTLVTNNIGDDQITNAKLANMAAKSVKANATNSTADPSDLAGSAAFQYLRVNSGNTGLEWATLSTHASTSIAYTSNQFQRAALTGEVTAGANSNATSITRSTDFGTTGSTAWTGAHRFEGGLMTTGDTTIRGRVDATLSADVDNLDMATFNIYRAVGTNFKLKGVIDTGGNGKVIFIANSDSDAQLIVENNTAATAARGFFCPGGVDFYVGPKSVVPAIYDDTNDRWYLMGQPADTISISGTLSTGAYSFTPPDGATWFEFWVTGAGGGGGGAQSNTTNGLVSAGGGGGGGCTIHGWMRIVSGNITGTIGTGGTAGSTSGGNGGAGGNSTLVYNSVTETATGGAGGTGTNAGADVGVVRFIAAGLGGNGSPTLGEEFNGEAGSFGMVFGGTSGAAAGGNGGSSLWGGGGQGGRPTAATNGGSNGQVGLAPGAGGGGGASIRVSTSNQSASGAAGASGSVRVVFHTGRPPSGLA